MSAKPLTREERDEIVAILDDDSVEYDERERDLARYEATVQAAEAERDQAQFEAEISGEAIMIFRHELEEVGIEATFASDVGVLAAAEITRLRAERDDLAQRVEALRAALEELYETCPVLSSKSKDYIRWSTLAEGIIVAAIKSDDAARGDQ